MAKTTTIRASLKITPKIKDVYYSFEYMEERQINDGDDVEYEKNKLWDEVYDTVANQINQTTENF
jgi:hypothetical protein